MAAPGFAFRSIQASFAAIVIILQDVTFGREASAARTLRRRHRNRPHPQHLRRVTVAIGLHDRCT
jgi:hypothetical protein